ncbi:polyprotein [Phytophthora megakarya]|uniref:Polyprotein n=1 Tax=Phytophthora megakarya TaxID=4795 RepID=A0A225V4L4_9STRA|nr:polyprotein [Phytophthora megakarya]
MNRTFVEMARSMLHHQQLDKAWWAEALMTAVYVINRLPNTARDKVTPYELVYKVKPDLRHHRVLGSRGFVLVDKSRRSKWDSKAHQCIVWGMHRNVRLTVSGMKRIIAL